MRQDVQVNRQGSALSLQLLLLNVHKVSAAARSRIGGQQEFTSLTDFHVVLGRVVTCDASPAYQWLLILFSEVKEMEG